MKVKDQEEFIGKLKAARIKMKEDYEKKIKVLQENVKHLEGKCKSAGIDFSFNFGGFSLFGGDDDKGGIGKDEWDKLNNEIQGYKE